MELKKKSPLTALGMVICCLFVLSGVTACSEQVDRLWLEAPGWSRAALIGQTSINLPVPMAVNDEGRMALFSINKEGDTHYPHIIGLERDGEVVWEHTIDVSMEKPTATQITWNGEEFILLWIDNRSLYSTSIDLSGNAIANPTLLSKEVVVDSFEIATAPNGAMILWFGGTYKSPGIYMLNLSETSGELILVDSKGIQPTVFFDEQGTLYAAWIIYPALGVDPLLYYAAYSEGVFQPDQQILVSEVSKRSDSLLEGPWIGLVSQQVYLFWNELVRSGRGIHRGKGMAIHFPIGAPETVGEPELILVPQTSEPNYEDLPDSESRIGQRLVLDFGDYSLISPETFVVSGFGDDEIVLEVILKIPDNEGYMLDQLGVLLYRASSTGYQLLTSTPLFSFAPTLRTNDSGEYYTTWIERAPGGGYSIYLASTASNIQETFSQLTEGDKERMVVDSVFGLLKGAVLALIAAPIWLVIPAIVIVLAWIFGKIEQSLAHPVSRAILALSLASFWGVKLFTFTRVKNILTFVPFSNWIPVIPNSLFIPLQIGIPLAVLLIALATAWYFAKAGRYSTPSLPLFIIVYGVADSLLTMAIYSEQLVSSF